MKKRIGYILLILCMVLVVLPMTVFAAEDGSIFASGDGESEDTAYTIATLAQLEAFRDSVNNDSESYAGKYIKLTADIDMSETYGAGKGKDGTYASWTPIGVFAGMDGNTDNPGAKPFKGTFDGNGYVIEVYINTTADNQGLFAYVGAGGTVKNLGIAGEITGKNRVGGVVGYIDSGTVTNCYNTGAVGGSALVGGVVGGLSGRPAVVENCYNTGAVSGTGSGGSIGGVVGFLLNGTVENCYNTGKVSGDITVSEGSYVGGIVGYMNAGAVENCYSTGLISGLTAGAVGTVVGYMNTGTVTNCYYLYASSLRGIGYGNDTTTQLTSTEFKDQDKFTGFDFDDTWEMNTFLGRPILQANPEITITIEGDGTFDNPFEIPDLAALEAFRNAVNSGNDFKDRFIKLTEDIDMLEKYGAGKGKDGTYASWTPIGYDSKRFRGTFDGNGHVIDVYINTTADNQGLFGCVSGDGAVKNLGIAGEITGKNYVGGVVGYMYSGTYGVVENCYNTGAVRGGYTVGGVVGGLSGRPAVVENCYNTGTVSGVDCVGGVVGQMRDGVAGDGVAVENCYNTGAVSGDTSGDTIVGGVVGRLYEGTVTNCYYLDTSCGKGIGEVDRGTDTTTAKTAVEFASGAVAYLLQGTQTEHIWGQTLGKDISPVFANETGSNKVYKVTFVVNDVTTVAYANSGTITIAAPVLDGYAFAGWYTAQTGGERVTTIDADDTTLYAQFTRNARTITFDPNGGKMDTTTATTDANGKLTTLPTPTRKNYNFLGWFTSSGEMVTTDTIFTEHTTVYAHWQIKASALLPTWQEWELIDKIVEANKKKDEPVETEPEETEPVETEPVEPEPTETEPVAEPWNNPFADVAETDAFYEAIKFVYENGYMNGMSNDTFAPNEGLTRGMLVTVLYRAAGSPIMDEANPFTDVADDAWYYNAVVWAKSIGLVNGITATEFAPEEELTREQLVTIFYRYASFLGYDLSIGEDTNILSYEDFADIAEYAIPAMQWACGAGLIDGADGNILPQDSATRALVAMVLFGFYA